MEAPELGVLATIHRAGPQEASVGIWGAMVCQWAREIDAEPRFLSPVLAQAFLQRWWHWLAPAPRTPGVGGARAGVRG